jgi:hypothetical protein
VKSQKQYQHQQYEEYLAYLAALVAHAAQENASGGGGGGTNDRQIVVNGKSLFILDTHDSNGNYFLLFDIRDQYVSLSSFREQDWEDLSDDLYNFAANHKDNYSFDGRTSRGIEAELKLHYVYYKGEFPDPQGEALIDNIGGTANDQYGRWIEYMPEQANWLADQFLQ